MNDNYVNEKLNSIRNEMSHIWGGIFVTGGGAATILSTANWTGIRIVLCMVGLIITIMFVNAYMIRKGELMNALNQLKKEQ